MMPGEVWWAAWSTAALRVGLRLAGGETRRWEIPRRMSAEHRDALRLFGLADGRLWLRSAEGRSARLDELTPEGPALLPGWPDALASLPPRCVIPLVDGSVAGLAGAGEELLLWRPGGELRRSPWPRHFDARAITRDGRGRLWAAGSTRSRRLVSRSRRHALAQSCDEGHAWQVDEASHGPLFNAWYSFIAGAEAEYRTVEAVGKWLVISARTTVPDLPSTVVYVGRPGRIWKSAILRHDGYGAALADGRGGLKVVSRRGRVLSTRGVRLRRLARGEIVSTVQRALADGIPAGRHARCEILCARAAGEAGLLVVASLWAPTGERLGEAVVLVDGERGTTLAINEDPELEIVTCWPA